MTKTLVRATFAVDFGVVIEGQGGFSTELIKKEIMEYNHEYLREAHWEFDVPKIEDAGCVDGPEEKPEPDYMKYYEGSYCDYYKYFDDGDACLHGDRKSHALAWPVCKPEYCPRLTEEQRAEVK